MTYIVLCSPDFRSISQLLRGPFNNYIHVTDVLESQLFRASGLWLNLEPCLDLVVVHSSMNEVMSPIIEVTDL